MKLDKDTIVKHHFWFLVAVAVVLALVGLVVVALSGPRAVNAAKKKVNDAWNPLKAQSQQFKSPKAVELMKKEAAELKDQHLTSHKSLFDAQDAAGVLTKWPEAMQREFDFKNGKFATLIEVLPAKAPKDGSKPGSNQIRGTLVKSDEDGFTVTRDDEENTTIRFLLGRKDFKVVEKDGDQVKDKGDASAFNKYQYHGRRVIVNYATGKLFGDELSNPEKKKYKETYESQLHDVLRELGPVNSLRKPQPVTLLRHTAKEDKSTFPGAKKDNKGADDVPKDIWLYSSGKLPAPDNRFFPYVGNWGPRSEEIPSEEIWAAQETVWVQRELFKRIKAANDMLAVCQPVDKQPTTFRNYYWEIDFKVTPQDITAKLKNVAPRQQALDDLHFLLRFKDVPEPILYPPEGSAFESQALAPDDSFESKPAMPLPPVAQGKELIGVEQLLTVDTAAVKRIDVVAIGAGANSETAVSHRQFPARLIPFPSKKSAVKPEVVKESEQPKKDNLPPKVVDSGTKEPGAATGTRGVVLNRYIEVTEQSRKLPINMVLIVGPEHMARVQAALVGSPLRFLETQVLWQHCRVPLSGGVPGGSGAADAAGPGQDNVELTIYGVVTLYQPP